MRLLDLLRLRLVTPRGPPYPSRLLVSYRTLALEGVCNSELFELTSGLQTYPAFVAKPQSATQQMQN